MKFNSSKLSYILLLLSAACASAVSTTTTKNNVYTEDLSGLRTAFLSTAEDSVLVEGPEHPIETGNEHAGLPVNERLSYVLDSINVLNKNNKFVDGYSIQVYSGLSREDAMNAKAELFRKLPDVNSDIIYTQPSFRVKVGKYYSKLEAQKDYLAIKRHFPNAILVPERISLDKM